MEGRISTLDFAMVDDLAMAAAEGSDLRETVRSLQVDSIGPLLEYFRCQRVEPNRLPSIQEFRGSPLTTELSALLKNGRNRSAGCGCTLNPRTAEFNWLPIDSSETRDPLWIAFRKRLENAAKGAGLNSHVAAGLCASFSEMADNVLVHSKEPGSGLGGYRYMPGLFEYVVTDDGIGVLESLRQSADYHHLTDSGTALVTALQDGESCYGRSSGHGYGFRQLFVSIAHEKGHLRFRSDDHLLEISETGPSLTHSRVSQVFFAKGFMGFVSCRSS